MGLFCQLHALRAILLACGLWLGLSSGLKAEALNPPVRDVVETVAEPFGLRASPLLGGGFTRNGGLQRRLDDDMVQLALCEGDREGCVSPAALRLLAIVDAARERHGRAKPGEINRAINLAIRAMSDEAQYGETDVWASPLATLSRGAGDCEDYAIAKFAALRLAGIAADDLRIVIMREPVRGEDHATPPRTRRTLVDARQPPHGMIWDVDARNYRPLFVIDVTAPGDARPRRCWPAPLARGRRHPSHRAPRCNPASLSNRRKAAGGTAQAG